MAGSLLEAFFFSFSADTKGVQEGIDAGKKGAKGLNEELNHTDAAAKKIGASFLDLAKSAGALVAGTLAFGAIKAMTIESANATNELQAQARELRTNADDLNAWQKVAIGAGGSAEGFANTLAMLNQRYRDPQRGLDALMRTAERFKGLNDFQADRLGAALGLDKGTIEAMRNGAQGLQLLLDRQHELSTVTREDTDVARKYRQQLADTNTVYDDVHRKIATQLLPSFTGFLKMMERITIWARDNKWFVLGFFGAVSAVILSVFAPAIGVAIVKTYLFLAPWIAIAVAVAAVAAVFALAFDDVQNFLEGNRSVIGEMEKKWPIVGDIVRGLAQAFGFLWDTAKVYLTLLIDFFTKGPQAAFDAFHNNIDLLVDKLSSAFPGLAGVFSMLGKIITGVGDAVGASWEAVFDGLRVALQWLIGAAGTALSLAGKAAAFLGFGGDTKEDAPQTDMEKRASKHADDIANAAIAAATGSGTGAADAANLAAAGAAQVQGAAAAPTNAQTSNSIANSSQNSSKQMNVSIPSVTINTQATSPDDIAKGFSKSMSEQLRNAHGQFDDGIAS